MTKLGAMFTLLLLAMTLGVARVHAMEETAGIEGTVSYKDQPVAGARVTVGERTVRTDASGRFVFSPQSVSGEFDLVDMEIRAGGYGQWTLLGARIFAGDTLIVTAEMQKRAVTVRQPAPTTRTGTQTSSSTGSYRTFATASHTTPPATIRVWVTGRTKCDKYAPGEVQVVDFKEYVKHVLPNEWFASWPQDSLRAGAMAAKSYAWYQINQGGKWPGLGADVMDSTCDQVYNPAVSYASTDQAVEDTWGQRVTRDGKIHISQYWAGWKYDSSGKRIGCNATREEVDALYPGRMSQCGSAYWAEQGKSWDWILTYYYDNVVISSATGDDLRLTSGLTVSSGTPVWGEPFTTSFTVRNDGSTNTELNELYLKLRGPAGEMADLGGDRNSLALAPGESRTIKVRVPRLAGSLIGKYGDYTLTATYRDINGLIGSALPVGETGTTSIRIIKVMAPTYGAQVLSVSESAPKYYEFTQRTVKIQVKNTGNATYRRATTVTTGAVRLGTAQTLNRNSRFYVAGSWFSPSRISMVETVVAPGGTATFNLRLGGDVAPGAYTEAFRLVSEAWPSGGPNAWFDPVTTLTPTILNDTSTPSATLVAPEYSTTDSNSLQYRVTWAGKDTGSGVASYEVQWYEGGFKTWLRTPHLGATFGASGQPTVLRPGKTYTLRVRAIDRAGNVGPWGARKATTVPVDNPSLSYTSDWSSASQTSYAHFARTLHYARSAGSVMKYKFYGRKIAWIGTTGPDKGRAEVWLDGSRVGVVDLYSSAYRVRTPIYQKSFTAGNGWHTIQIRPLGKANAASTGTRVDIDGLAAVR